MEEPLKELLAGAVTQHATLKKVKQLLMGVSSISLKKTALICLSLWKWAVNPTAFHHDGDAF